MSEYDDPVDALIKAWRSELPGIDGVETELRKRITLAHAALDRVMRSVIERFDLTPAEFDVLVALRRTGTPFEVRPRELARSLLLSSGGVSNVTNRLESRGLLVRRPDPHDARSSWLQLTVDGVALAEEALIAAADADRIAMGHIGEQTLREVNAALRVLALQPGALH